MTKRIGTVKFWLEATGYGFLIPPDGGSGPDIFIHLKECRKAGIGTPLKPGQKIAYEIGSPDPNKKPMAMRLEAVDE
jgi:cold shock CspA family protein